MPFGTHQGPADLAFPKNRLRHLNGLLTLPGKVFVSILIQEKKFSNTAKEVSAKKKKNQYVSFLRNKIKAKLSLSYLTQQVTLALTEQRRNLQYCFCIRLFPGTKKNTKPSAASLSFPSLGVRGTRGTSEARDHTRHRCHDAGRQPQQT